MRTKIKAVRLLSLLCLCFGAASMLLWRYTPATVGQADQTAVYEITDIPVSEITAVAITNKQASFGVMQKEGALEVVSDTEGSYDQAQLRALVYAASHLTGSRKNTDPESWAGYGYGDAQAVVSLFRQDGSTVSFAVLMQNPIDQNYYVFSEDEQAVFLVSQKDVELFLRGDREFFIRSVFPVVTAANYDKVQAVSLDFGGSGRSYTLEQQGGVFRLTSPIVQRLPASTVLQELLGYVSALYADQLVAQEADLSQYGFDAYTLKITMTYEGREYTALLLDEGGDSCLMANPDTGSVYRVAGSNIALLRRDYLTLLGGVAYQYSAGDLRSLAITGGGQSLLYEISGQGEGLTAVSGGSRLDSAAFVELMQALNSAAIQREVPPDETVQGQPALMLTFTLQTGSVEQVDFIPASQGSYYVRINNVTNFTTEAAVLDGIRAAANLT